MDGLDLYGSEYLRIRFQSAILDKVIKLETSIRNLSPKGLSRTCFLEKHALRVGRFMLGLQNLLAATSEEKSDFVLWSSDLSNKDFAVVIWDFYQAFADVDRLAILARCLQTKHNHDEFLSLAAMRTVTTLARMLDPYRWGVSCWRTMACLGFDSMTDLKRVRLRSRMEMVQAEFSEVTIEDIVEANAAMRMLVCPGLPSAAGVAAALYCISLDLWPTDLPFERVDPLTLQPDLSCKVFSARSAISAP